MDTYRGQWLDRGSIEDAAEPDRFEPDDREAQVPVSPVGQDERRMQVRAYNHWAGLLGNRSFPSIEDLEPEDLPDFGPHSVLLDFTAGIENPGIAYLGAELARECGITEGIETLDEVPSRSLLSRITDHYMQILANQAPIGFEAEFVNQRSRTIMYRGILLPFSTDDDTIDFIYGVINWKEIADARTTDELLLEVDQAIDRASDTFDDEAGADVLDLAAWSVEDAAAPVEPEAHLFADEPAIEHGARFAALAMPEAAPIAFPEPAFGAAPLTLEVPANEDSPPPLLATKTAPSTRVLPGYLPEQEDYGDEDDTAEEAELSDDTFGSLMGAHDSAEPPEFDEDEEEYEGEAGGDEVASLHLAPPTPVEDEALSHAAEPLPTPFEPALVVAEAEGLADTLALARELAHQAIHSEDRTRSALYAAIGRAYDVSLAAADSPREFAALIADAGLTVQERAPMTPVVKLVFGADYDKTRLAEFASALSHAHRIGVPRGDLAGVLTGFDGGLKQLVAAERKLRRQEAGLGEQRDTPRDALARKLRQLEYGALDSVSPDGNEFTLLVARRLPTGEVVLLGEVAEDVVLLEKAARKLIG